MSLPSLTSPCNQSLCLDRSITANWLFSPSISLTHSLYSRLIIQFNSARTHYNIFFLFCAECNLKLKKRSHFFTFFGIRQGILHIIMTDDYFHLLNALFKPFYIHFEEIFLLNCWKRSLRRSGKKKLCVRPSLFLFLLHIIFFYIFSLFFWY